MTATAAAIEKQIWRELTTGKSRRWFNRLNKVFPERAEQLVKEARRRGIKK